MFDGIDKTWTHEMVTEDLTRMLENYGASFKSVNEAASVIQVMRFDARAVTNIN